MVLLEETVYKTTKETTRYKVNNAFSKPNLTDSHCLKHTILYQRGAENVFHLTCKAMTYDLISMYIVDRKTLVEKFLSRDKNNPQDA